MTELALSFHFDSVNNQWLGNEEDFYRRGAELML